MYFLYVLLKRTLAISRDHVGWVIRGWPAAVFLLPGLVCAFMRFMH